MPARFRPTDRKEPWTLTGLEIQAKINERYRQTLPFIRSGEQSTLDRFEAKEPISLFERAEQILSSA